MEMQTLRCFWRRFKIMGLNIYLNNLKTIDMQYAYINLCFNAGNIITKYQVILFRFVASRAMRVILAVYFRRRFNTSHTLLHNTLYAVSLLDFTHLYSFLIRSSASTTCKIAERWRRWGETEIPQI